MGTIFYPTRAKPELIIEIPTLESYSLSRPAQRLQSRQVTPGGRAVVTGLGKKIQFLNLNIKNLSETDKDTLVDLLDNSLNGSMYTFDYLDAQGNDYYGCRLWQGDEDFVQAFYQRYEENLLIRVNPTQHIYAGSSSGGKIFRSADGATWTEVEDSAEVQIMAMAVYKGYLYAATGNSAKIYRSIDGLTWSEVYDSTDEYVYCLAVFDGYLYAGTGNDGKIYRSATGASGDWAEVKDFDAGDAGYVYDLVVFGDYLYAATGNAGKIYRSANGTTWTEVEDLTDNQVWCLAVFTETTAGATRYLYAGTGASGRILRSSDGETWSEVYDPSQADISDLTVFGDYLYAASGANGKIYRSANGTTWTEVADLTESEVHCLTVFNGNIYAGTDTNGKIYRSANGTTWTEVYDSTETDIKSLTVFTM